LQRTIWVVLLKRAGRTVPLAHVVRAAAYDMDGMVVPNVLELAAALHAAGALAPLDRSDISVELLSLLALAEPSGNNPRIMGLARAVINARRDDDVAALRPAVVRALRRLDVPFYDEDDFLAYTWPTFLRTIA